VADEEMQRDELESQLNNWKKKRAEAAIGDDDSKFDEMHAQVLKAEEALHKAQEKLNKT
jgi:hypothetical protein